MKNQFVSYEITLKLKELGFNEPCLAFYFPTKSFEIRNYFTTGCNINSRFNDEYKKILAAPLWQQVIDWLREKNGIIIGYFNVNVKTDLQFMWTISTINEIELDIPTMSSRCFKEYHKAREQAILKAIEIITQNKTE